MTRASSPLSSEVVLHAGAVPITRAVVTTSIIVVVLGLLCWASTRRMNPIPGRWQAALESVVAAVERQLREILQRDPEPFLPVLGTLFLFIAVANLSALLPGVSAPTASIETPVALGIVVFVSVHVYGVRAQGLRRYLRTYFEPNPLFLPLNILSEITRTFSLMVRLFGNMMSHELVIGIVATIAGLFVPIPFMALGILIGLIQAYIFAMLATLFVAAAIGGTPKE